MGRAFSTNGERGMYIGYWWESHKERDYTMRSFITCKAPSIIRMIKSRIFPYQRLNASTSLYENSCVYHGT
jgi:hypothetical protein